MFAKELKSMGSKAVSPKLWCAIVGAALLLAGCENGPCPPGAQLKGAAPPKGFETWCEKIVDGRPVKEGHFVLYGPSGQKMLEGDYKDGKQEGFWLTFHDNGQRATLDEYHGGILSGQHVGWHMNGEKSEEGQYINGKRDGHWRHWDNSGLKNWDETYKDDKKVS